jgi:ABC-type thiamine transport system ATPase subunit
LGFKKLTEEQKRRLEEAARGILPQEMQSEQKPYRLALQMKRPGIARFLGSENPLKDEEFEELSKHFRIKRERI